MLTNRSLEKFLVDVFLKFVSGLNAGWVEAASFYTHGCVVQCAFLIHEITRVTLVTSQLLIECHGNVVVFIIVNASRELIITIEKFVSSFAIRQGKSSYHWSRIIL